MKKRILLLVFWIFAACTPETPPATRTPAPKSARTATSSPSASSSPLREMTICLGGEPNTLYPYGDPNDAARSVLAVIFPPPVLVHGYHLEPGILQKIPSLEDGDAVIERVRVSTGDEVLNSDGNPVVLARGTRIRPAGCRSKDCEITYDGKTSVEMEQMVVTFRLRENLRWSDGEPLTSDDSIYAFDLLASKDTPASKYLVERTAAYEAIDPLTVQWRGKPGFVDALYATHFFAPMPMHLWGKFSAASLVNAEAAARYPVGWGAYVLKEWVDGEEIRLVRNPLYYRAEENLPQMDALTFRFYPRADEALAALLSGECDFLAPDIPLGSYASLLRSLEAKGEIQVASASAPAIEYLFFGIRPSAYDDGIPGGHDRPDILGDARTRRALASCLDREGAAASVLLGWAQIPDSFVLPESPFYNADSTVYAYAPSAGAQQLENLGWRDVDGDPATPRISQGVAGVPDGTLLTLEYVTTDSPQRRQVSELLAQSLRSCGVGVTLHFLSPEEFFTSGKEGVLFGRNFDLAEFSLYAESFLPPCEWFTSEEIPQEANGWEGLNVSGYRNPAFDEACEHARAAPDDISYSLKTQEIFTEDIPALPLFVQVQLAVARPDFCHLSLDATAGAFWNIDSLGYGEDCAP